MDQIFPGYTSFVQEDCNNLSLRKKKKKKQPQHAMNYFNQSATIAETVSNALEPAGCLL